MRAALVVLALGLAACDGVTTIERPPPDVITITESVPVPGETQVIEVPVPVQDTALVRLLLRGLGEIGELECVVAHEHQHRADVCAIITNTLQGVGTLP